ncbi:hypothetical protein [Natronincola ferrireducens]|uniref:Uncharacterized protein n=1 Tax=Natronincola ferrireducens TaxID=393762 RepID=A0A1G9IIN2_9FIRM|nr:hypothetical protein [Natronincola ferrireducens]SDL24896.1 hypothetical protein SAMN05660472_02880 [Natronincola ferrireducens]
MLTAVIKAINELLANKEPFISILQKNITTVLNEEKENAIADINGQLEELQQQLLQQAKSKNDYNEVADEMTEFSNEQSYELEEYDEQLVRRLIEKSDS